MLFAHQARVLYAKKKFRLQQNFCTAFIFKLLGT